MRRKNIVKFVLFLTLLFLSMYLIYLSYNKNDINKKLDFSSYLIHIKKDKATIKTDDYIAYLKIPDLNINRGLYKFKDKRNNVQKEVMVLETSNFSNGDIVLAAHSGEGFNAYFNTLDQLDVGMPIYIIYNNYIYTYKYLFKEEIEKTGYVDIKTYSFPTLKLITCKKNDNKKQIVFTTKLISKEKKDA